MQLHLNSEAMHYFPRSKLPEYMSPQMLDIRVPCSKYAWDAKDCLVTASNKDVPLKISDLFIGSPTKHTPESLSDVIACDFTAGMALGCFYTRGSDESYHSLLLRIRPFLSRETRGFSMWDTA